MILCKLCKERERAGADSYCRKCRSSYNKQWRKLNPERAKYHNLYSERRRAYVQKWRKANPEKVKAHLLVQNKSIKKKETCESCGSRQNLHGHHPDYKRPDYIVTLCVYCHRAEHSKTKK